MIEFFGDRAPFPLYKGMDDFPLPSPPLSEGLELALKWDTVDSLLTDTSVKRTLRVAPCLSLLVLFDSL